MNEHKFYDEYVLPVLLEVQDEFKKREVETKVSGDGLLIHEDSVTYMMCIYRAHKGEYYVSPSFHHLFDNTFHRGVSKELIFKTIKPKSIYNLEIGDEFYFIDYLGFKARANKCKISSEPIYKYYKGLVEQDEAFLTQEECETRIAKTQALSKIKSRAYELQGDWKPDWKNRDEQKHYIKYDHEDNKLVTLNCVITQHDNFYVKTYEIARQIIDELPEECKLMLEVE